MTDTVDTNVNTGTNPETGATTVAQTSGANVPPSPAGDGNTTTPVDAGAVGNSTVAQLDYSTLNIPEELKSEASFLEDFKQTVDKYGLISNDPKKTAEGLMNFIKDAALESNIEEANRLKELTRANEEALKKDPEFGKDYFGNMKLAVDSIAKFGGDELVKFMQDNPSMNYPVLLKAFANIGKQINDAKIITGGTTSAAPDRPRDVNGNPMLSFDKSFPSNN